MTLTVVGFPSVTYPGILGDLNRLAIPYRWCTGAIALDKTDAARVLTRIRPQWFARRKSVRVKELCLVLRNAPRARLEGRLRTRRLKPGLPTIPESADRSGLRALCSWPSFETALARLLRTRAEIVSQGSYRARSHSPYRRERF
jgi:hypothetical protein